MASMHCDAFYPKVSQSGFWGPLLKLDRVVAMELGTDKRLGNFECLIALNDSENGMEDGRQVGSIPGAGQVLDFIFRMLIPPQVLEKYVVDYERAGIVGAVVVDTFMEHVPSARKGRRRVNTAYLSNLAVSPLCRRMGVGSALLARAEEVAGSWGCAFMTLHVDASNNAGIELYRSAGYRFVARQPEWQRILEGRSTGLVLMVKRLKSS